MSDRTKTLLKRLALVLWLSVVGYIVVSRALEMDWPEVLEALASFDALTLAVGFALGVPALVACASFDLVGRRATGHGLPVRLVMLISYTGYFFSLNLGALVGGVAFRYRLYMPFGLPGMTISQVIGLSVVTNWSGYVPVAGLLLALRPPALPPEWGVGEAALRASGFLLLAVAAGYFSLCAIKGGTRIRWRDSEFELPNLRIAALQVVLSVVSWSSIGAIITWLLGGTVSWLTVMPVLMVSALAGAWSHVPSGLGVTELVFLELLGHEVAAGQLLAALLAFRLLYYIIPFAAAVAAYAWLEARARSRGSGATDA